MVHRSSDKDKGGSAWHEEGCSLDTPVLPILISLEGCLLDTLLQGVGLDKCWWSSHEDDAQVDSSQGDGGGGAGELRCAGGSVPVDGSQDRLSNWDGGGGARDWRSGLRGLYQDQRKHYVSIGCCAQQANVRGAWLHDHCLVAVLHGHCMAA
jgi:hypothetical protein